MHPAKALEEIVGWDSTESLRKVSPNRWVITTWRGISLPTTILSCQIDESEWSELFLEFEAQLIYPSDSEEMGTMKLLLVHFDEIIATMNEKFVAPFEISLERDGLKLSGSAL